MNIFEESKRKSIEDIVTEYRNEVNSKQIKLEKLKEYLVNINNSIEKYNLLKLKAEKLLDDAFDRLDENYDVWSEIIEKYSIKIEKINKLIADAIKFKTEIDYTYKHINHVKDIYQQQIINFELHNHVKYT